MLKLIFFENVFFSKSDIHQADEFLSIVALIYFSFNAYKLNLTSKLSYREDLVQSHFWVILEPLF